MSTINFVKSDNPKQKLGSIRQSPTGLQFDGVGQQVFNSLKRAYGADPPKDATLFSVLASGWSNGPVKTVVTED
jgi:hypothetical protein